MQMDPWYDLMVRELSELTDTTTELLKDAEGTNPLLPDADTPEAGESVVPPILVPRGVRRVSPGRAGGAVSKGWLPASLRPADSVKRTS